MAQALNALRPKALAASRRSARGAREAAGELAPLLKWAGGKRWQIPQLQPLWAAHRHRRLVEPFCGGLSVALGLRPARAVLNDANPHLINFYRWVQRGLTLELRLANDEALFYAQRARFNALLASGHAESREAAGLFYYLNRTGFNGLCRFNRAGFFNVPFGRYATINYATSFEPHREGFRAFEFTAGDFDGLSLKPADFVYADPPYDVEFTEYSAGGFGWEDQQRVAARLAAHPGPVILVNQATERILELYGRHGFALRRLDAPRRISCNGDRAPASEVFATRNL